MNDRQPGLIQRAAERLRHQQPGTAVVPPAPLPIAPQAVALDLDSVRPPAPLPETPESRISREVKIDRQRLAKEGITFSVNERSRIAEEFRIVSRQILAKAESLPGGPGGSP